MRLVVFFNAKLEVAREAGLPADVTVLADPRRHVYDALGTKRISKLALLKSLPAGLDAARRGRLPHLTRSDMQRLGADVAVRADGEIARLHVATSPADRLATAELIAAL